MGTSSKIKKGLDTKRLSGAPQLNALASNFGSALGFDFDVTTAITAKTAHKSDKIKARESKVAGLPAPKPQIVIKHPNA
jgi:shikimate kinase